MLERTVLRSGVRDHVVQNLPWGRKLTSWINWEPIKDVAHALPELILFASSKATTGTPFSRSQGWTSRTFSSLLSSNLTSPNSTHHSSHAYAPTGFELLFLSPVFPWSILLEQTLEYRCKDGRLTVSSCCVTISNPDLPSSSETGVNPGIRSWKEHLSEWARCQEAIGGIYFTKKWRAETLQPGLEFDNFKPRLKISIFKCISWLNGLFLGRWLGFSERGSQGLSNATNFASYLANFFSPSSHL